MRVLSIEKVRAFFHRHGIEDRVQEFAVSSATVELAASALGCQPARIAKTLALDAKDSAILLVTAGDARIDNAKFKAQFGVKAKMIPPEQLPRRTGYAMGGVCPFETVRGAQVYLDESLRRFDCVYPACGSDNSGIGLSPGELEQYSEALGWVDVCKSWREQQ